jgi:hypothetical protein
LIPSSYIFFFGFFIFGPKDLISSSTEILIGSKNDDGDKWSKARKFQDNEIVFTGFGPWSLMKNLHLKPEGSCKALCLLDLALGH